MPRWGAGGLFPGPRPRSPPLRPATPGGGHCGGAPAKLKGRWCLAGGLAPKVKPLKTTESSQRPPHGNLGGWAHGLGNGYYVQARGARPPRFGAPPPGTFGAI